MATTIKLKNGSGAPLAGDLVQGEPALDLTNKRLYTEDSGGTVIEVGTNPTSLTTGTFTSTGIDDNATSTAITIDSSENVGIGTASPVSLGAGYKNIDVRHTTGGGLTLGDTSNIHAYLFSDNNGVTLQSPGSRSIKFTTGSTERMRIDSSGNLLVGTTVLTDVSSSGTGNEGAYIKSDGSVGLATSNGTVAIFNRKSTHGVMLDFRKDGTTVGSISTNGNSLPSDRNFKKNIEDLRLGLNFVSSLNPVTYNYKMDDDDSPIMTGLIAQDVETALEAAGVEPNSMTLLQHKPIEDEKESDYQMDYLKLVPVLINAVKELSAQVDELKAEVAALKGA